MNPFKRFIEFLKEDSWPSLIVFLVLVFLFIKFLVFPLLSFLTGTSLPLVIVESCSMYHDTYGQQGLETILESPIYEENNISFEDTENWPLKNGLNKGDIVFVLGPENVEVGDIVIFAANSRHPIIHRVINTTENTITTKGDNNSGILPTEKEINKDRLMGKAVFRVPAIGWIKLIFFEFSKSPSEQGLC